jgi:hypothetical protein
VLAGTEVVRFAAGAGGALVAVQLARAVGRPAGVDVCVLPEMLVIRLRGWDAVWAQRRSVRVPLHAVAGVCVESLDRLPVGGVPIWGTAVPGLLRVGTIRVRGVREFWNARRSGPLLRIECDPAAPYRRLMLQVPDPTAAALRLRSHVGVWMPPGR